MEVDEFKAFLIESGPEAVCDNTLFDNENWFFTNSTEVQLTDGYTKFRQTVSEQIGTTPDDIFLVGSSKYGYSLSPRKDKTFSSFHEESDLDLVVISEPLFREVWSELLTAYHSGYRWVMDRHSNEIFRKFAHLIENGNYNTTLLRSRVKILDGISSHVFLQTGVSRTLKYRIYESREAVLDYHISGLEKIRRRLENDN